MNTQFTPGPWTQGLKGDFAHHNANNIYDRHANCIASIPGVPLHCSVEDLKKSDNADDREGMANARLIAAAPALFEAITRIARINVHEDYTYDQKQDMIERETTAALALAGGGK